jgi:hypothetical protein
MARRRNPWKVMVVSLLATFVGIGVEFLGFRMERYLIGLSPPEILSFSLSFLFLFLGPFLTTGPIIYSYSKSVFTALFFSSLVIPLTLLLLLYS